ncbi:TPA: hypothetical protein KNG82_002203 [Escherichia coli]|nr:hypothetical protein [Escherichia coli]
MNKEKAAELNKIKATISHLEQANKLHHEQIKLNNKLIKDLYRQAARIENPLGVNLDFPESIPF